MLMAWLEGNSKEGEAWIDVSAASSPGKKVSDK